MIHEKDRRSNEAKFGPGNSKPVDIEARTKKVVLVVIIVETFLNGVIAGSEALNHVAKFCRGSVSDSMGRKCTIITR